MSCRAYNFIGIRFKIPRLGLLDITAAWAVHREFFIYFGVLGLPLLPFGSFWGALGLPWGALGLLWDPLGLPWDALGLIWGALGLPRNALGFL